MCILISIGVVIVIIIAVLIAYGAGAFDPSDDSSNKNSGVTTVAPPGWKQSLLCLASF